MKYVIMTTVENVYHHEPVVRVDHKVGNADAVVHTADKGWFVRLAGSYESIHVGKDKPVMQIGDRVKITIELDQSQ